MKYLSFVGLLILCFSQSFGIKPLKKYQTTPNQYNLPFTDKMLVSTDSALISTWYLRHDSIPKGTYMLAYGDAGNKSYLVQHAYMFYHQGYDVLLFDYRGFGGSSDFQHDSTFLYHKEYFEDFQTVYDYVQSVNRGPRLHIYAQSMGTIFAIRVQLLDNNFLILDSPVLSLKYARKALLKSKNKKLKTPKLHPKHSPKNLIIFYGLKDILIQSKDIETYINGKAVLLNVLDVNHLGSISYLQNSYFDFIRLAVN